MEQARLKYIHAADVHLDSPLRGLERYDGAPVAAMRGATRRAFENLVALAISETVDLVLLAGDLYDGEWKDYNTGLFFAQQMGRLQEAGIQVLMIAGNHDAASQMTKSLRLPENVYSFSTAQPETRILDRFGIAVHGQGFATRAVSADLTRDYPLALPGLFNIGLLHTSLDGRPGHEPYAPCNLDGLRSRGYDYWALGHVHQREILSEEPWVVFPGNLQGRHARETGAKGCVLAQVEDGQLTAITHPALDVARWAVCEVNLTDVATLDAVGDRVEPILRTAVADADQRLLAVRLRLVGACPIHARLSADPEPLINTCRALANSLGADDLWVENVLIETRGTAAALSLDRALDRDDALGGLLRAVCDLELDPQRLSSLAGEVADLGVKLPLALRAGEDGFDPARPDDLRACLEDVKSLLLDRLLGRDDDAETSL